MCPIRGLWQLAMGGSPVGTGVTFQGFEGLPSNLKLSPSRKLLQLASSVNPQPLPPQTLAVAQWQLRNVK